MSMASLAAKLDRDAALIATRHVRGEPLTADETRMLADAVLRHCGSAGAVPMTAAPDDRTMPVSGAVLGAIDGDAEPSDGTITDESYDGPTSARVDHTAMFRSDDGRPMIAKRGGAAFVEITPTPAPRKGR